MATYAPRLVSRTRMVFTVSALLMATLFSYAMYFAITVKATSTTILISEFRTRGPAGGNDEFVELYNASASPIDISGWKINASNSAGTIGTRLTINAGTTIPSHGHFLATNNGIGPYSGAVPGNQTYGTGITDDGGIAILDASNVIIDQVGMSAGSAYKEGTVLVALTTNVNRGYERKPGGSSGSTTDTDSNSADFAILAPSDPQNLSSTPTPNVNQPINTSCPTPLNTTEGLPGFVGVSATDPDGVVTSAVITSSPVAGITLDSFVAAPGLGGTASATLNVAGTTAPGTYNVVIQYANNDSPTPQTATCTIVVTVNPAATPTPTPTPSPSPTPTPIPAGSVVISQVYGGGGNSGATLKNDFIELINHTDQPISLSGWSVQYASATLSNWQVTPLNSFTLQPGQYYLIKEAAGAGGTVDLPASDTDGSIAMGATSGKVALVSNTTPLVGTCPSDAGIIDFVGYDGANCFEGAGAAPTLANTTAALRGNAGCLDTDNNSTDFTAGAPNPRNSSTPTHDCTILSATGSANPSTVQPGDSTLLTVDVSPAPNPPSTGISVVADLSSIGGSPTQSFSGAGNTFTFNATVSVATTPGIKLIPVTVNDAQARVANTSIQLSVQALLPANHITISQVYGGGGNTGATYTNDYVELYNPTGSTVTITGWSLQYASATGNSWTNKQPLGGIIGPGEHYLVSLASGGSVGSPLPVLPNISGDINMAQGAGKVALVSNSDNLSGICPLGTDPDIVDFVGYGSTANCHEGSANAPAPSASNAIFRKANGLTDTDQNGADFSAAAANPRRTAPIVELGPWVAGTDPLTNDTTIPHDASITINFSEPVNVVGQWYDITCAGSGPHNDATVASSANGKTYVITPNVNFQFSEQCTVTINKDAVHDQDLDDSDPNTDTLFSDYVWSFLVVAQGTNAYPSSVHLTMGNPSNAIADVLQFDNYLMEKPSFTLSYNRDKGSPNWVSWHLDDLWVGNLARVDTFRPDPAVPADWYRVQASDFFATGFDRGHMTPNADRDNPASIPLNQETFLMSNMVAQAPGNNQGPWADLENYLRTLLPANELYIVAGPAGVGGIGSNTPASVTTTVANGHVTVPEFTWKVALVLPKGESDVTRVTAASRTIAVIMPNQDSIRGHDWHEYLTTVDAVEALTGYDFFSNVPDSIENAIEAGTDGTNPPGTENQSVSTAEDSAVSINLTAVSPNPSATFTFTIVTPPAHGTLSGPNDNPTYQPGPDFNGSDSFTFKANDGSAFSNTSTVSISVTEVNDAPVANTDSGSTNEDTSVNLSAADFTTNDSAGPADEASQTLSVTSVSATGNTHGTVSLNNGTVTYSPAANYNGPASFEYQVCDNGNTNGALDSKCATGTVNLTVNPVNDGPTANSQSVSTDGAPVAITLTGSDQETAPANLIFQVTSGPSHGSLTGSGANLTYTPALAYNGPDSFQFTVKDSGDGSAAALTSSPAVVSITVNDTINPEITAPSDINMGTGAGATSCGLVISDAVLGSATATDNAGSVSISRTGVPAGNFFPVGTTVITYTATDGSGNTASDTQTVTVTDTTAPTLTLNGNHISLWPPNHNYQTVGVTDLVAGASDNCDPTVNLSKVVIAKVTSDEVEFGPGSGTTTNDIVIGADCKTVQLRAERESGGDGRVYTIWFKVSDSAGNTTMKSATVVVPLNGNNGPAIDSGVSYTVNGNCP